MTAKTYKGKVFKRRMQSLMLCTKATDAQNETAQRLKAYSQDQQEEDGTIRVRFYGEYCRDGMQPVYSYRLDGKNRHCQSCSGEVGQRGRQVSLPSWMYFMVAIFNALHEKPKRVSSLRFLDALNSAVKRLPGCDLKTFALLLLRYTLNTLWIFVADNDCYPGHSHLTPQPASHKGGALSRATSV